MVSIVAKRTPSKQQQQQPFRLRIGTVLVGAALVAVLLVTYNVRSSLAHFDDETKKDGGAAGTSSSSSSGVVASPARTGLANNDNDKKKKSRRTSTRERDPADGIRLSSDGRRKEDVPSAPSSGIANMPDLKIADFIVDRYLGSGDINIGVLASLPRELAERYGLWDAKRDEPVWLVLKFIDTSEYEHTEVESFERLMSIDTEEAERAGLMQAIWIARDAENPYYCHKAVEKGRRWNDNKCIAAGAKESFSKLSTDDLYFLRTTKTMDVMALRYYRKRFITDTAHDIRDYKIFLKSTLEQLALAHSAGTNNRDLNESRNLYVDETTGGAILFDWNGHVPLGKVVHDSSQHMGIAPPEAWLHAAFGVDALTTHVHAFDIWQVGVMWTNILYRPCQWPFAWVLQGKHSAKKKAFLQKLINTLGGNTVIPVNDKESVDLRELAGMRSEPEPPAKFRPLLSERKRPDTACRHKSWYLDDPKVSDSDKEMALDFIKQALRISPSDRPLADELLKHPVFNGIEVPR